MLQVHKLFNPNIKVHGDTSVHPQDVKLPAGFSSLMVVTLFGPSSFTTRNWAKPVSFSTPMAAICKCTFDICLCEGVGPQDHSSPS